MALAWAIVLVLMAVPREFPSCPQVWEHALKTMLGTQAGQRKAGWGDPLHQSSTEESISWPLISGVIQVDVPKGNPGGQEAGPSTGASATVAIKTFYLFV